MIGDEDFKKWVESAHCIFEIFEGRHDVYPLARKWIDEWFDDNKYKVLVEDSKILLSQKENFDYRALGIDNDAMINKIGTQYTELLKLLEKNRFENNVGFAVAPYLFGWNFQRFKVYFRRNRNFSLSRYFQDLGEVVEAKKGEFYELKEKKLVNNEINETLVTSIFSDVNDKLKQLGINQNEPVGTAKLLHILAPHYFPLIDNPIAEAVKLKGYRKSLTSSDYYNWMFYLQSWLKSRLVIIKDVETKFNQSILKLVDEGFYVMSSINLSLRLEELGVIPQR